MASIEEHVRADGGTSCIVRWRVGGTREGNRETETFGAGTDAQNRARAEGFKRMVTAAGEHWPDGWVKGAGFVRDRGPEADPTAPPRSVEEVGLEYVSQIVDCSPGQRSRYLGQLRVEQLLHRERRCWHVLRVLEHDRVAREDLGGRYAHDLVVGEVPRLNRVQDP
jgi:hypothetical protein